MEDAMGELAGRHVLIMATDRFEESELFEPRERLLSAGARVSLASASISNRPMAPTCCAPCMIIPSAETIGGPAAGSS